MKTFALVLILATGLYAQLPQVTYHGRGCGWFAAANHDLVVTRLPRIGGTLELRTSIPPYGVDWLAWGRSSPGWTLPQPAVNGRACKLYAWWIPHILRTGIPIRQFQQFSIPNDPSLIGVQVSVQQMNQDVWVTPNRWETSRGVVLKLGR